MDIDTKCLSVFKSFINDIIKVFPEYKIKLEDVYGDLLKMDTCVLDQQELLKEFLERVHKLDKKITNKDDTVFNDDPVILTDISFKNIWTTNISVKTKESIWKYLQTFCLLYINHKSNKQLQEALSGFSDDKQVNLSDKKVASDVKKIKKMAENMQKPLPEPEPEPEQTASDNPFAEMENMMNSSDIGKIAKEVSESLDLESMLGGGDGGNPMELMQKLMSGDAMGKIMGQIHNVVNEKVESGELDRDSMVKEAQGLYQNMGDNPLMRSMAQPQQTPQQANNPHQSNKTRARLQKKLKEKQKIQVNKVDSSK